jgi:hypothetical protein
MAFVGPAPEDPGGAPDLTRKVLGYRSFVVARYVALGATEPQPVLGSVAQGYMWNRGVNRARCLAAANMAPYELTPHEAPSSACACGLYGLHRTLPEWEAPGWLSTGRALGDGPAAAVILAWGRMEVHPEGFRGEYAEVVALVGAAEGQLVELTGFYKVPILSLEEVKDHERMKRLGESIPESLLPNEKWLREQPWPPHVPRLGVAAPRFAGGSAAIGATSMMSGRPPAGPVPTAAGLTSAQLGMMKYSSGISAAQLAAAMRTPPHVMTSPSVTHVMLPPGVLPGPPPPMMWLTKFAIALNLLCAVLNVLLLVERGHWWNALAFCINLGGVLFLLLQRRWLCRKYEQG